MDLHIERKKIPRAQNTFGEARNLRECGVMTELARRQRSEGSKKSEEGSGVDHGEGCCKRQREELGQRRV